MTDPTNPAHYQGFSNGSEVIDIAEHLSFNLGNTVKYCARGKKDPGKHIEDLEKAQFYLNREIDRLKKDWLESTIPSPDWVYSETPVETPNGLSHWKYAKGGHNA